MDLVKWLRVQWDRAGAWACVAAGAVALILGWVGVSGSGYAADQLPYIISGGVGGVFLLGLGAMLWISADLRDEWVKLDGVEARLEGVQVAIRDRGIVYVAANLTPTHPMEGRQDVTFVPGLGPLRYESDPTPPWGIDDPAGETQPFRSGQQGAVNGQPRRRSARAPSELRATGSAVA